MQDGRLEIAGSTKTTTEAGKRLSMGGGGGGKECNKNKTQWGEAVKKWFKGEGVHKIVNLEK